jgi:hypothetical protein
VAELGVGSSSAIVSGFEDCSIATLKKPRVNAGLELAGSEPNFARVSRIGDRSRLSPFADLPPHTIRKRRAALMLAGLEEVGQRIDVRRGDVRVGGEIRGRIEAERRIAAFVPAELVVVVERVHACSLHVGVGVKMSRYPSVSNSAFGLRPSFQPVVWKWRNGSIPAAATSGLFAR